MAEGFPIVYVDPPWEYNQRSVHTESKFGGGASGEYNLELPEGMASWAPQFHAMRPRSGVMLMWVTGPFSEAAPALMRAWGYTPIKPILYWAKTTPSGGIFCGPGYYTMSNVEYILMGQANKGRTYAPVNRKAVGGDGIGIADVHLEPHPRDERGKIIHSKKPGLFRDLAVRLFGDVPRVEVFAREQFAGWHAIGDQLPGGEPLEAGRIIRPLPPPQFDIAHRRVGDTEQRGLWGTYG